MKNSATKRARLLTVTFTFTQNVNVMKTTYLIKAKKYSL